MSSYEQNLNVSVDYSPNFPNVSQHDAKHTNKISIYHFDRIFEKNSMATRLQCQPDTYTNTTNWQNLLQQQLQNHTTRAPTSVFLSESSKMCTLVWWPGHAWTGHGHKSSALKTRLWTEFTPAFLASAMSEIGIWCFSVEFKSMTDLFNVVNTLWSLLQWIVSKSRLIATPLAVLFSLPLEWKWTWLLAETCSVCSFKFCRFWAQ